MYLALIRGDGVTLTNRLLVFFLATLALVLVGFSVTLYFLARDNFYHESEEHLESVFTALVAAVEVDSDGVRWLPAKKEANLSGIETSGTFAWLIRDDQGRVIDHSNQTDIAEFPIPISHVSAADSHGDEFVKWQGANWLVRQTQVIQQEHQAANESSESTETIDSQKHSSFSITTAISLNPVEHTLLRLATLLILLSGGVWTAALFLGRALCRRALLPLTYMATAAGQIDAAAFERRLPITSAHDELHDLGQSFNGLLDRLQESFERQKQFTSDASHQLRTPLTAILGQAEVALRKDRPADEYQRVLRNIQRGAVHLREIIESLLFLARADREAMPPETADIEIQDWLRLYLKTWEHHPRFGDFVFEPQDHRDCRVKLHPVLAGELINVLLENACKYSQPGTPIQVQVEHVADEVRLLVRDQGIGIGEHELERVFAPFFRASQVRDRVVEGVGLGLSIANRLAEAFGGSLSVTSHVGAGSCFMLTLPVAAEPSAEPANTMPLASRK